MFRASTARAAYLVGDEETAATESHLSPRPPRKRHPRSVPLEASPALLERSEPPSPH